MEAQRSNATADFRIRHSKDHEAYREVVRLEADVAKVAPWRPRHRALQAELEAARERCLQAGVDWANAPRPPRTLRAPDRSRRVRVGAEGARAPAGWAPKPPAGGKAPSLSLAGTLNFTSQAAAATAARSEPRSPSATAAGSGAGAASAAGAGTGVATAAAAYGAADAGSFTAVAASEWLDSSPTPAFGDAEGNSWFEAEDGSVWFQDAQGAAYTLGADGNFFALSPDGMLYGEAPDGTSITWSPEGIPLTMDDNAQLWAADMQQPMLYGEDGQFYTPEDAVRTVSFASEGEDPIESMLPGLGEDGIIGDDPQGVGSADEGWFAASDEFVGDELSGREGVYAGGEDWADGQDLSGGEDWAGDEDDFFGADPLPDDQTAVDDWAGVPDASPPPADHYADTDTDTDWDA
jgi:hypothetical protein